MEAPFNRDDGDAIFSVGTGGAFCLHDFHPQMLDQNHSISNTHQEMDIVFAMPVLRDLRLLFTIEVALRMKR